MIFVKHKIPFFKMLLKIKNINDYDYYANMQCNRHFYIYNYYANRLVSRDLCKFLVLNMRVTWFLQYTCFRNSVFKFLEC